MSQNQFVLDMMRFQRHYQTIYFATLALARPFTYRETFSTIILFTFR